MITTIKMMMVALMAFNVFNSTIMIQDSNKKTINVLGASYTQEQIVSEQLNDMKNKLFEDESQTSQTLPLDMIEKIAVEQEDSQKGETSAKASTETPKAKASTNSSSTKSKTTSKTTTSTSTETASKSSGYYVKTYKITHYCGCEKCNPGNAGRTASGKSLKVGMIAMRGVPFGTVVEINGKKYVVEDRCASSSVIDVYVETHSGALQKGTYTAKVKIYY